MGKIIEIIGILMVFIGIVMMFYFGMFLGIRSWFEPIPIPFDFFSFSGAAIMFIGFCFCAISEHYGKY